MNFLNTNSDSVNHPCKKNNANTNVFLSDFDLIFKHFKAKNAVYLMEEDIIVCEFDLMSEKKIIDPETMPPLRLNALTFFICRFGNINIGVNYQSHYLSKGSIFILNSRHIVENIHIKSNYRGYLLILSQSFIRSIFEMVPSIKNLIDSIDNNEPIVKVEENELRHITRIIEDIMKILKTTDHAFQRYIVRNEAANFVMEVANNHLKSLKRHSNINKKNSLKDENIRKFIILVLNHCKEQHEVSFYAKELCMSPSNLSRIMANSSGKSPMKWISDAIIAEAKILLRNPSLNIQQVSEELHFGNQSSFGKFFKKHTGFTPIGYKNNTQ